MKLIIRDNPLDVNSDQKFDTDDAVALIFSMFKSWNPNNKIYHDSVDVENEMPFGTKEQIEAIGKVDTVLYVVIYPQGLGLIAAGLIGATVAVTQLGKDKTSTSASSTATSTVEDAEVSEPSPNNSLSERSNSNRLNSRIPDIYGTVISTPDLIMESVKIGDTEYQYLCVGEGEYELSEFKDGISDFSGDLEVYGPGTSPNSGHSPQMRIGNPITRKISIIQQIEDVEVEFDLIDKEEIELDVSQSQTSTSELDPPFFSYNRFGGGGGTLRVTYVELDANSNEIGDSFSTILSATTQVFSFPSKSNWRVAISITNGLGYVFEENPDYDGSFGGDRYVAREQYTIEYSLDGAFSSSELDISNFGNVTTIYTKVTASGDSNRSRKLTCKASRKIPILNSNLTFGEASTTSQIKDIIPAITTSPSVGNRPLSELNLQNLIDIQADIVSYFGSSKAAEFNYTFDDENLSFEETMLIVCETAFCSAYRRGLQIEFFFEKQIDTSTLLFNHRNKLPNSETRNVSFGNLDDHDGVEVVYQNEVTRLPASVYIPDDQSAVNPEKITEIGVTNRLQAYFHAHRAWNRIRYQNTAVEFDATQEAALLRRRERILVADNTRPGTQDGEVIALVGNVLSLSQDIQFEEGETYTIFLQNADGAIVSKAITPGNARNEVNLASPSGLTLSLESEHYARTTYEIVKDGSVKKQAFLVEEKQPLDNFSSTIRCVNYDNRYYKNDKDLINGVVDSDGIIV